MDFSLCVFCLLLCISGSFYSTHGNEQMQMLRMQQRVNGCSPSHDSPCVSQIRGVMQGAPPSRISLVDVGCVLEQELAGDERTLKQRCQQSEWYLEERYFKNRILFKHPQLYFVLKDAIFVLFDFILHLVGDWCFYFLSYLLFQFFLRSHHYLTNSWFIVQYWFSGSCSAMATVQIYCGR